MITFVVDTREQEFYSFSPERIAVERRALPAGDYSLAGYERRVAIERKTLEDFVHTVIRERDRFRRELQALRNYEFSCVVVEASLEDILAGAFRSGAHPSSILGAALSIIVDYGVPVYFCSNRQCARRFVEELLLRFHKKAQDVCNQPHQSISDSGEKSPESSIPPPASRPGDLSPTEGIPSSSPGTSWLPKGSR